MESVRGANLAALSALEPREISLLIEGTKTEENSFGRRQGEVSENVETVGPLRPELIAVIEPLHSGAVGTENEEVRIPDGAGPDVEAFADRAGPQEWIADLHQRTRPLRHRAGLERNRDIG